MSEKGDQISAFITVKQVHGVLDLYAEGPVLCIM